MATNDVGCDCQLKTILLTVTDCLPGLLAVHSSLNTDWTLDIDRSPVSAYCKTLRFCSRRNL